jgi:hypothetical protein
MMQPEAITSEFDKLLVCKLGTAVVYILMNITDNLKARARSIDELTN